jgi:hypothetical protein
MKDAQISNEKTSPSVFVDLRIPGMWSRPEDLIERLPDSYRVIQQKLILPDGSQIPIGFPPADKQFPGIFHSVCRQPPTKKERAIVDGYTINVTLSGCGGSMEAAHRIMQAAATIIKAGGAGVFIDNSMLAHGGEHWLEMTEDGGFDALSFAFVGIIRTNTDIWTAGMHVLGLRDIVVKRTDIMEDYDVVELIRSMVRKDRRIENGHSVAGVDGTCYSCRAEEGELRRISIPMRNPFGRLRLARLLN